MRRILPVLLLLAAVFPVSAEEVPVSRRDGFLLLWNTINRPAVASRAAPFSDLPSGEHGSFEITFAKGRGILESDDPLFRPHDPLTLEDAVLWLVRTRNIEPINVEEGTGMMAIAKPEDLPMILERYPIITLTEPQRTVSEEELRNMITLMDLKLREETHEVSLYSEKFHGKGTGFGETFDMHAMTAAHRTFPHNTLVRVTNIANGKSVTVRINDRGPFKIGRNMDLSLAAFLAIEERSKGILNATFERLGDVSLVGSCGDDRAQRRIAPGVVLTPGIPLAHPLEEPLRLTSESFFVVRSITRPDGTELPVQRWIEPGSAYEFLPDMTGIHSFHFSTADGRNRVMETDIVACG